jgi:exosortase D (VPLPA-CTERM-specific)
MTVSEQAGVRNRYWWIPGVAVLASLVLAYLPTLEKLASQWIRNEDYSHGILIVPIACYLTWQKRRELRAVEVGSDWRALPVLFLALFIFILGELGAELYTIRLSLLIFLVGAVWLLYGPGVLRILRFPLAFLLLMLPLPGFIYRNVTFPLQLLSSMGAVKMLQAVGMSVYREGNVIDVGFMQLQVVDACNGLRYILPLLSLGVLFAYLGQKVLWKRIVLVAATVPVAILANVLRIAGTSWIGTHWGADAANGFFHAFSGWVVFMVCFGLFALLSLILRVLPGKVRGSERKPSQPTTNRCRTSGSWGPALVAVLVILGTPSIVSSLGSVPPVPLTRPLSAFPLDLGEWEGERSDIAPKIWEKVGGQDYVLIDYHREKKAPINFYVAYYEYQRKAGDFVHSPRLCLPGAGWFIESNHVRRLPSKDGSGLRFNELIIQKNNVKQLVYFWYQGRGRNFTNEFAAKFYMVWDGLWRRRTDGALVRLITPLMEEQNAKQARAVMDRFALAVSKLLSEHLP